MALTNSTDQCAHCHLQIVPNGWTYFVKFLCGHIEHVECFICSPLTNPPHQCSTCGLAHTIDELIFFK